MKTCLLPVLISVGLLICTGCATYIPPSGRADLGTISSFTMQESFAAKPAHLESDRELREAAARLKAAMLLLYTFDTSFHDNDGANHESDSMG